MLVILWFSFFVQADVTLSRDFRLRKSSMGDTPSSKYPPNSTGVDKLITDQLKEHQKVILSASCFFRLAFRLQLVDHDLDIKEKMFRRYNHAP